MQLRKPTCSNTLLLIYLHSTNSLWVSMEIWFWLQRSNKNIIPRNYIINYLITNEIVTNWHKIHRRIRRINMAIQAVESCGETYEANMKIRKQLKKRRSKLMVLVVDLGEPFSSTLIWTVQLIFLYSWIKYFPLNSLRLFQIPS